MEIFQKKIAGQEVLLLPGYFVMPQRFSAAQHRQPFGRPKRQLLCWQQIVRIQQPRYILLYCDPRPRVCALLFPAAAVLLRGSVMRPDFRESVKAPCCRSLTAE